MPVDPTHQIGLVCASTQKWRGILGRSLFRANDLPMENNRS